MCQEEKPIMLRTVTVGDKCKDDFCKSLIYLHLSSRIITLIPASFWFKIPCACTYLNYKIAHDLTYALLFVGNILV